MKVLKIKEQRNEIGLDFLQSSQNNRELTNKLHAYWRSDPQSLATGRFVRGQKRADDVPPTLDAWLTFGGAAGEDSQGVIDAFASFKSSEEYYNIEGSVGSRVAQQLQKGDKIRIGINGVVQSNDFRIKKWSKDSSVSSTPQHEQDKRQPSVDGVGSIEEEGLTAEIVQKETGEKKEGGVTQSQADPAEDDAQNDVDEDFKELVIGDLDDLLEDLTAETTKPTPSPVTEVGHTMHQQTNGSPEKSPPPPVIVPLSWDDQCTKPDVKVIQPTISPPESFRPVMSETFPVRFEKLISEGAPPRLAQGRKDGYKIKQRPLSKTSNKQGTSSKVKVVYIDPLSAEDENKVNTMSVEEIVSYKVESRERDGSRGFSNRGYSRESTNSVNNPSTNNIITINENMGPPVMSNQQRSGLSAKNGVASSGGGGAKRGGNSRPGSHHSLASDHARVSSPKFKTLPVHPAVLQQNQTDLSDLSIMNKTGRAENCEPTAQGRSSRSGTPTVRTSPSKHGNQRVNSGHGGPSIRAMGSTQQQTTASGEAEYIKITSQLKMGGIPFSPSNSYPVAAQYNHHKQNQPYEFSPGSNTPRDLDYQEAVPGDYYQIRDDPSNHGSHPDHQHAHAAPTANPAQKSNEHFAAHARVGSASEDKRKTDAVDTRASSPLSESPPATTVAISIPTADELSDREESPSHSPARGARISPDSAALTSKEKRERDFRNEQIDQITDLIGGNIVNDV
ncbi:hypothetical protein ElyMa_002470700 [Elysia marginata]|uniref:Uncharacterized protein n=1 Tax=Elysia marginata TaxID=1093978 RepID=A0AAV4GLG3_9GAST|nr:hypothetical protein ElyMa_002470700 [Elysia marginata]